MRRLVRVIAVLALVLGVLTVGFGSATAAPVDASRAGFAAATANCTGPSGYPVKAGATISVSTTNPYHGQTIVVTGSNFRAGEVVTIYLGATQAAQTHADSKGGFRISLRVTSAAGKVQLRAVGAVCGSAALSLLVRSASGVEPTSAQNTPPGAGSGAAGNSAGGLAFTGLDIAALIALAIALLAGGLYLTRAGRRRHSLS